MQAFFSGFKRSRLTVGCNNWLISIGLCLVSLLVASVETQGRSIRAGITVAKVFKKELNQMFVSDGTQKKLLFLPIQRPDIMLLL